MKPTDTKDVRKVVIVKSDGSEIVLNADKDTHFAVTALVKDSGGDEDGYWSLGLIHGRENQIYESLFQLLTRHPDLLLYFIARIAEDVAEQKAKGKESPNWNNVDLSKMTTRGNA